MLGMLKPKKEKVPPPTTATTGTSAESAPSEQQQTEAGTEGKGPTSAAEEEGDAAATTSAGRAAISLFPMKKKEAKSENGKSKKRTPGEIRIQKDIAELDSGTVANVIFPNPNDLTNFDVDISPDSGFWKGAKYNFNFSIPADYSHRPPKVTCRTKIYHPNINLEGAVCLNILREDWKPVLDINAVIYGLIYLFYEPNPDDPLNREAADLYRRNRTDFAQVVQRTLRGYSHSGESFPKLI